MGLSFFSKMDGKPTFLLTLRSKIVKAKIGGFFTANFYAHLSLLCSGNADAYERVFQTAYF